MSIDNIRDALPDYAKDLKLNLSSLLNDSVLDRAAALGHASSPPRWRRATRSSSPRSPATRAQHLAPEALNAAKAAASIMAMNNIYYRFTHLASRPDYKTMPARLRMNVIAKPGVDKVDFELWSLAVSAINGCGMCIDAHEKVLREAGVSREQIQAGGAHRLGGPRRRRHARRRTESRRLIPTPEGGMPCRPPITTTRPPGKRSLRA